MMMGMSVESFWNSTPGDLQPYVDYHEKRIYELDRLAHMMGSYVYEAVGIALANALSKSKTSSKSYPQKPHMATVEKERNLERLTEEEKLQEVEKIFKMLTSGHEK